MSSERESVNAISLADAPYLGQRLAARKPAGVLSLLEEIDGHYDGVPLVVDPGNGQPIMMVGKVNLHYCSTMYPSGAVAVESLQEAIGPNQAGDFLGIPGPVYFHDLTLLEYYGPGGVQQPQETPELQPVAQPYGSFKAVWSTATVNDLPDSSFLLIESGGEKDEEGKTKPRSLRHFPYKDADGKVDLPHLRNAIARIPQAEIEGFDEAKQTALQDKARAILEKETAKEEKTEKGVDLAKLPTEILAALFQGLDSQYRSGLATADMPPEKIRERGQEVYAEIKKRAPNVTMMSPLLVNPPAKSAPSIECKITKVAKAKDPDYMYVLSLVMEPREADNPDFDYECYDKEAIRKLAFPYVAKFRNLGFMHDGDQLDPSDAYMVQSYVVDDEWTLTTDKGIEYKEGTWFLGAEVKRSSIVGKGIESGTIGAWSIQGLALKKPERAAA